MHELRKMDRGVERAPSSAGLLLGGLLALVLCSCTRVAAYERGRLAHPSMSARQRPSAGQAHLYAIREGARGGSPGAGSGCGCN